MEETRYLKEKISDLEQKCEQEEKNLARFQEKQIDLE